MVSAIWPPIASTVPGSEVRDAADGGADGGEALHYGGHPGKGVDEHEVDEACAKQVSECAAEITGRVALVDHVLNGSDKDLDEQESKEEPGGVGLDGGRVSSCRARELSTDSVWIHGDSLRVYTGSDSLDGSDGWRRWFLGFEGVSRIRC